MLFNSFEFFIFFPLVTVIYFLLPHKFRALFLLAASFFFYMAFIPAYIFLPLFTIGVNFWAGRAIEDAAGKRRKKLLLCLSIVASLAVLIIFKYYNFIHENVAAIARALDLHYPLPILRIILPIGLSFYTFQAIGYAIDVYRGEQRAERNPVVFALYVMFYPQLVAGPIERSSNLIPQFYRKHHFEYKRVSDGLKLMALGLFQKVVLADRLAPLVNQVYANPREYQGISLIVATVFFAFQIYCDFAGYSNIAIGSAQVMGFKLMNNFNRPYFSRSAGEFWKRWHISLSSWFRDYVYIPLGGNRVSAPRWSLNIMVTFLLSGLWHGANWNFVIWGGLNGAYILFSHWMKPARERFSRITRLDKLPLLRAVLGVISTFSLISFSWIFFRAANFRDAAYISTHLFSGVAGYLSQALTHIGLLGKGSGFFLPIIMGDKYGFLIGVLAIIFMEFVYSLHKDGDLREMFYGRQGWQRWTLYYSFIFIILVFGVFNRSQFIYFQF